MPSARSGRAIAKLDTSATSRGVADLGRGLNALSTTFANIAEDPTAEFETERRFQEFKWAEQQALDQSMREVEPGKADGFADGWASSYTEKARAFFDTVPDRLKPKYDAKLFDTERSLFGAAAQFGRHEQKRYSINALEDHKNKLALAPDLNQARTDYDEILNTNKFLSPIEKDEIRRKHLDDIEESHVEWRIRRGDDLDEIIRELESGGSPTERASPQSAIERHEDGMATVSAGSGARFRVSANYAERFAGALADLEAAGVEVKGDQSGGYANRNIRGTSTPSQHKFGRAIDINWHENARGSKGKIDPELARSVAKKWGLKWGGDWSNPDPMHFEIDTRAKPEAEYKVAAAKPDSAADAGQAKLPGESRYQFLSTRRRAALVYKAKVAQSAVTQQAVADDIERIRRTGQPEIAEDGSTSLDKAARVLGKNQVDKLKIAWDEARMEYDAIAPLKGMSELEDEEGLSEVDRHLQAISPDEKLPEESYKSRARVLNKTLDQWKKIQEERRKDPAMAVNDAPEVRTAFEQIGKRVPEVTIVQDEDGEIDVATNEGAPVVSAQKAQKMVIEARLQAQARLGIPESLRKPITKRQAERLLDMPDPSIIDEKTFIDKLRSAADRAEQVYGPEYGKPALEAAVRFKLRDKEHKEAAAGVLAKMARREPVTARDISRMNTLDEIGMMDRVFSDQFLPDYAMQETARPFISPQFGRETLLGITDYASREANRKPNEQQQQWIRDNPDQWRLFDQKFGRGAAAKVLGNETGKN